MRAAHVIDAALPMSLPHALLTALVERSSSGLELARRFDKSIGFFWQATHQQIYRELARLEKTGWVESKPLESGRGRKKVYSVLPAGREELRRWAGARQEMRPMREELMVRLRAEAAVGRTDIAEDIARRQTLHRERLALYREVEAHDFAAAEGSDEACSGDYARQVQHLILSAGILHEIFWLQWTEQALAVLQGSKSEPAAPKATAGPETVPSGMTPDE